MSNALTSSPLGYLDAAGAHAQRILPLTWYTLVISIAVCLVITVLLLLAIRRNPVDGTLAVHEVPVERGGNGLRWITVGLSISAIPLLVALVWTMMVLAAIAGPPTKPVLVLDITARQWWWNVHYNGEQPSDAFDTANEIHIPVGQPVLVRLHAADVIHSFWVPKLSGKTDMIPGQTNQSWMQAETPGRYLGQCSEFCGFQHAHMQFEVVAQSPAEFAAWKEAQLKPAPDPVTPEAKRGEELMETRCGMCHQVRGTRAGATAAPDLTHLMSRKMIASGALENTPGNLAGWIDVPQSMKPDSFMPNQDLSGQQINDELAYLETLQ